MGGFFGGGPPAPDTSAADAERARIQAENDKLKQQNAARLRNRRAGAQGRASLLAFQGSEQGVQPGGDKLGA